MLYSQIMEQINKKKLFKGTFNVSGQNIILFSQSGTKERAFENFINQLCKRTKLGKINLKYMFGGQKDNYLIQEVRKDEK